MDDTDDDTLDQEADAAATLELSVPSLSSNQRDTQADLSCLASLSLALGRSRAKSPGGNEGDFTATSRHQNAPVSPFSFSAQDLGPNTGNQANGLALNFNNARSRGKMDYKALMRQSVVEVLPPQVLARQLVTFDVECVSWLHW